MANMQDANAPARRANLASRIYLSHIAMMDLPPPDLVGAAAAAGYAGVTFHLGPEESFRMRSGDVMLAETLAILADTGLKVIDVDVVRIGGADNPPERYDRLFETAARLDCPSLTVVSDATDESEAAGLLAAMAERAGGFGRVLNIEPVSYLGIATPASAARVIERSGADVGLLADPLHIHRAGASPSELPRHLVRHVQLCDAPSRPPSPDRRGRHAEAGLHRLPPGEGRLPLAAFIACVPHDVPVSLEVPNTALRALLTPAELAARLLDAAVEVLAGAAA